MRESSFFFGFAGRGRVEVPILFKIPTKTEANRLQIVIAGGQSYLFSL